MKNTLFLFALGAAFLLGTIRPAQAKSCYDLIKEADLILEGVIGEKESLWSEDHSQIYTFVTLHYIDVIDGDYKDPTFTLRYDGGEVEESGIMYGQKASIVPEFPIGDHVVVFVQDNTESVCPLAGDFEGLLLVKKDAQTGKEKLFAPVSGLEIAGVDTDGRFLLKPPSEEELQKAMPKIEEEDPHARELRLKYEEKKRIGRDQVRSMEFTLNDLKRLVKKESSEFKKEGKKISRRALSADIHPPLTGRHFRATGKGVR